MRLPTESDARHQDKTKKKSWLKKLVTRINTPSKPKQQQVVEPQVVEPQIVQSQVAQPQPIGLTGVRIGQLQSEQEQDVVEQKLGYIKQTNLLSSQRAEAEQSLELQRKQLEEENRKLQTNAKATQAQRDFLEKRWTEIEAESKRQTEHYENELARLKQELEVQARSTAVENVVDQDIITERDTLLEINQRQVEENEEVKRESYALKTQMTMQ